jgi:hypothetical protein
VQGGDLASELVPRLVLVFENLVGILPANWVNRAACEAFIRAKRWKLAADHLDVNEPLARQMWHITWHLGYQLEVVTYWDAKAVEHVQNWVDDKGLPVHRVWFIEPNKLARKIATMPDLAAIFDPDPAHQLTYGKKGRIINPSQPDLLNAW